MTKIEEEESMIVNKKVSAILKLKNADSVLANNKNKKILFFNPVNAKKL
jgi:hypothetical protein